MRLKLEVAIVSLSYCKLWQSHVAQSLVLSSPRAMCVAWGWVCPQSPRRTHAELGGETFSVSPPTFHILFKIHYPCGCGDHTSVSFNLGWPLKSYYCNKTSLNEAFVGLVILMNWEQTIGTKQWEAHDFLRRTLHGMQSVMEDVEHWGTLGHPLELQNFY